MAAEYDSMLLDFASSLCARLCHDISSPLGTLAGTLELIGDDGEQAAEALALAGDAADALAARLRLLRAAWAGDCGRLGRAQLSALAAGLPRRVTADLAGLADLAFDAPLARVLLNLLLLGAEALPRGGTVALAGEPGTGVVVTVTGPSVRWHDALAAALLDPAAAPADPRSVQVPLTVRLAAAAGLRLSFLLAAGHGPQNAPRLLLAPP